MTTLKVITFMSLFILLIPSNLYYTKNVIVDSITKFKLKQKRKEKKNEKQRDTDICMYIDKAVVKEETQNGGAHARVLSYSLRHD